MHFVRPLQLRYAWLLCCVALTALLVPPALAAPRDVSFGASTSPVAAWDFIEITAAVAQPDVRNPFLDAQFAGDFRDPTGRSWHVEGFADSDDGGTYRLRFMPMATGEYTWHVVYRQAGFEREQSGRFNALEAHRRGIVRVDARYPWHFIWAGTGEHYFFNGTTAYMLMGFTDERVIEAAIDRLHGYEINRMRVLLSGRWGHGFAGEPIVPTDKFHITVNPWVAQYPEDTRPNFDYTRFNLPYWQKYERMLRYARERDMVISVVLDWNDSPVHPAALSDDERRYYRYAAARLAAFSNVSWDLGDDISAFRSLEWSHTMGSLLEQLDPYAHLATDHPIDNTQQDRTSAWFGFTSFQQWPRPLHEWMLNQRRLQQATGRIIPQTDEEYGYEDHYPIWSPSYPDGASADADRRAAWEIQMAGCYQTTGETAKRGTGVWPDTGGGWVNGRGDDSMTMLAGYRHMVDFFTSFEWWRLEPHDELVSGGSAYCLAEVGRTYCLYLPMGQSVAARLAPGSYVATWFNPRSGKRTAIGTVAGGVWHSPDPPDHGDWAVLLERR